MQPRHGRQGCQAGQSRVGARPFAFRSSPGGGTAKPAKRTGGHAKAAQRPCSKQTDIGRARRSHHPRGCRGAPVFGKGRPVFPSPQCGGTGEGCFGSGRDFYSASAVISAGMRTSTTRVTGTKYIAAATATANNQAAATCQPGNQLVITNPCTRRRGHS